MEASRVTGAEVARLAGVSKTAVSQVFGGTGRISAETSARVLAAARELGYVPDHAARSLRLRRTGMLTMIVPQLDNPYYLEIFAGGQATAAERGYTLDLFTAADATAARAKLRQLGTGVSDGVVISAEAGIEDLAEELRTLNARGVGVAVTQAAGPDPRIPGVRVDLEHGARLAIRHLLDLGHRRIAYVGNRADAAARARDPRHPGDGRWRGYRAVLAEAGIAYDEALVHAADPTARGGARCSAALTAPAGPSPTAVFAFNDLVAMGILHGLAMAGVRVPADLSVVGFDGIELSEFTVPALTTVAHPREDLGRQAVARLCDQLAGGDGSPGGSGGGSGNGSGGEDDAETHAGAKAEAVRDVVLTPRLVIRGSTGVCAVNR
ncbi:MAG TPA: LacI family DNA-binding transcriptional regulator [Actinospica sp.]|nr:LacI family DNA-binding transcriptional regulator [Actinospica sp.]